MKKIYFIMAFALSLTACDDNDDFKTSIDDGVYLSGCLEEDDNPGAYYIEEVAVTDDLVTVTVQDYNDEACTQEVGTPQVDLEDLALNYSGEFLANGVSYFGLEIPNTAFERNTITVIMPFKHNGTTLIVPEDGPTAEVEIDGASLVEFFADFIADPEGEGTVYTRQ